MEFAQATLDGLITGAILAIGAVGLSLTFGVLKIVNFAHGELLTIGAFTAFVVNVTLGLPLPVAFLAAMLVSAVVAMLGGIVIWQPLAKRRFGEVQTMLMSLGLSIFLRNIISFVWGADYKTMDVDKYSTVHVLGAVMSISQAYIAPTAVVCILALVVILYYTRFGKQMRAMSSNRDLASISGVKVARIALGTWLVVGLLGGLAGAMAGTINVVEPNLGFAMSVSLFAAAILGGIGDPLGTLIGALAIGLVQSWASLVINTSYAPAVGFAIMIIALVVRPRGLLGGATQ